SVAPPLTWDGRIFALCKARKGHILCALDLKDGKLTAKKQLSKAPAGELHVWGRHVYVRSSEKQLSAFRVAGKSLIQGWKYSDSAPESVRVLENEVYARTAGAIVRLSTSSCSASRAGAVRVSRSPCCAAATARRSRHAPSPARRAARRHPRS
ncbi:MAG: hypothetical protein ACYTGZ_21670, partial [Planctomycetota bacterium]